MNSITTYLALGAIALGLTASSHAAQIVGDIHVTAFGSTAQVNTTTNTVVFDPVAPGANGQVSYATGSWTGLLGTAVSYASFQYSPLSITAVTGWAPNTVWRIDADSYFVLNSITSMSEGATLGLLGLGTAFHNGFTPTPGSWSFSADASGSAFSFSSTLVPTPDSGSSIVLLGSALATLGLISRRRTIAT